MTMKEYNRRMCNENGPGLVWPEIPTTKTFALKGHILNMLKDIPFFSKDHKDMQKYINGVLDNAGYFNIPDMTKVAVMLGLLPVTLKDVEKTCLELLQSGAITTCDNLKGEFIKQFSPPSKIVKLNKNIQNSQQLDEESL